MRLIGFLNLNRCVSSMTFAFWAVMIVVRSFIIRRGICGRMTVILGLWLMFIRLRRLGHEPGEV
jgi:hypothetical protein